MLSAPPARSAAVTLDRLEQFLGELVTALERPPRPVPRGRGRPPILPGLLLWSGLLVCVLRRETSQLALWRLLTGSGLWHFPAVAISDDAVYKRLERDGATAMERFFTDLTAVLTARLDPHAARPLAPFAAEVYALDETTLDPIARTLPSLRGAPPGDDCLLPGKLAGLFDVRRQLWHTLQHVPNPHQNEKLTAPDLVAVLPPDVLLLCDLGYFAFEWFDDLTDAKRWWVSRLRAKTSYTVLHVFYQEGETLDALVWLGAYRADRAKHAVRLVQFRAGQTRHCYLTNVRDPAQLPLAEIARLYARRWDIEQAVNLVKTDLGLHLLWSAKPSVVLAQVWAVLAIAQILQALRLVVAAAAEVDPFEVSLPLLVHYLPQYARHGVDPIAAFVHDGRRLHFIRPSRRTTIHAPTIPSAALTPPPADLILERQPRYAHRKCGPRSRIATVM